MSHAQAQMETQRNSKKLWLFLLLVVTSVTLVLTALLPSMAPNEKGRSPLPMEGRQPTTLPRASSRTKHIPQANIVANDILQLDKEAFYRDHNLEGDLPGRATVWKPLDPLAKFWIHQLQSDDPQRKQIAINIFQQASIGGHTGTYDAFTAEHNDANSIRQSILYLANREAFRPRMPGAAHDFTALTEMPELNAIIEYFITRLDTPEHSNTALQVLNFFSLDVYAEKDINWWHQNYSGSKLHAMLTGRPSTEWLVLPE